MASSDNPPLFTAVTRRPVTPPPDIPPPEPESEEGRTGSRAVPSVTFVDEAGNPWQFSYGHFYRAYAEGRRLVVEFSEHKVVLEGTRLFSPAKDCLLRRLGQHKAEFVEAVPRGEFDADGVTAVRVEPVKR